VDDEYDLISFSPKFYKQLLRQYSFDQKLQSQTVIIKKLCKIFLYKKAAHKMLLKLTPFLVAPLAGVAVVLASVGSIGLTAAAPIEWINPIIFFYNCNFTQ